MLSFSQTLPGSSFAANSHFTSAISKSHKAPAEKRQALVGDVLITIGSFEAAGPSRLNIFFHISFSTLRATTSFKYFPFDFPPKRIKHFDISRAQKSSRGVGILPFASITLHFLSYSEKTEILSRLGGAGSLLALKDIFFFGCSAWGSALSF